MEDSGCANGINSVYVHGGSGSRAVALSVFVVTGIWEAPKLLTTLGVPTNDSLVFLVLEQTIGSASSHGYTGITRAGFGFPKLFGAFFRPGAEQACLLR